MEERAANNFDVEGDDLSPDSLVVFLSLPPILAPVKLLHLLITSACLLAPLAAQQVEKKAENKVDIAVEVQKPSLTFYYFDG